jgi:hypothetical protein
MWERGERKHVLDGRRGKKVRMRFEERETIERNERERKERGEIVNEDGREIRWMKEI